MRKQQTVQVSDQDAANSQRSDQGAEIPVKLLEACQKQSIASTSWTTHTLVRLLRIRTPETCRDLLKPDVLTPSGIQGNSTRLMNVPLCKLQSKTLQQRVARDARCHNCTLYICMRTHSNTFRLGPVQCANWSQTAAAAAAASAALMGFLGSAPSGRLDAPNHQTVGTQARRHAAKQAATQQQHSQQQRRYNTTGH